MTTQEGLPALATDDDIAELKAGLDGVTPGPWWSDSERGDQFDAYAVYANNYDHKPMSICDTHNADAVSIEQEDGRPWDEQGRKNMGHLARCSPDRIRALLDRLATAERQVKELRKELTFVGDMAVYALKTDDDDTSGILATIRDTSRAALEAKSHDD